MFKNLFPQIHLVSMWLIFKCEFNGAKRPFSNIGTVVVVDTGKVRKRNGLDSIIHFVPNPLLTLTSFQFHTILFVDPFWLWTFCSFCSKSVTYFLSISSNLFARPFWLDVVFLFSKIWQMSSGQSLICLSAQPKLQTTTENEKLHFFKI